MPHNTNNNLTYEGLFKQKFLKENLGSLIYILCKEGEIGWGL